MNEWTFTTKSKGDVEIEWTDDDEFIVRTPTHPQKLIGSISFTHIEGVDRHDEDRYLVTNMYLDGPDESGDYIGQGIGREIIESVREWGRVTFHYGDGTRRDDGGHLTGDGPGFASKMVAEGLASWEEGEQ